MNHATAALASDELRPLIAQAVLAPSSHNSQPWLWQLRDGGVALFADRTRALPVNDPDDRELTISCGCALLNLRVAAADAGLSSEVAVLPDAGDADCLAAVALRPAPAAPEADAELSFAIAQRRTYRQRFASRPVSHGVVDALTAVAKDEGAWLQVVAGDAARQAVAALVAEGDAAQWASPSWRRELAAWMHPRRRGDGLAQPGLAAPLAQALVRSFDMGSGVAARDQQLAEGSPLLAVLGTDSDGERDWLAAGQALQRVLLTACMRGLQASFLNQAIQVPALRLKLQHVVGRRGFAQLLLRIGYPDRSVAAAPRRGLDEVIRAS